MQTGEDNSERDVQTDEVTCSDRWVQWPPEDLKGFGGVCVCVCVLQQQGKCYQLKLHCSFQMIAHMSHVYVIFFKIECKHMEFATTKLQTDAHVGAIGLCLTPALPLVHHAALSVVCGTELHANQALIFSLN